MTGRPKWPHEPDGGYPIGAKSPGDDPVQFEAAVAKMVSYAKLRGLAGRPILFDLAFMVWPAACWCIAGIGLALALMLSPPVETVDAGAIVQRPNVYAHVPFLWLGGACLAFAIQSLPARLFPWLAEAAAWRDMNTKWFRQNLRHHWLEQGAVGFDPQRALEREYFLPLSALLAFGAGVLAFGLWLRVLGERDVHRVSPSGLTSVSFWTSRGTRHSFLGVNAVKIDCSLRGSGRSSRTWIAEIRYTLSNRQTTVITMRQNDSELFAAMPAIDDAMRASGTRAAWASSYDDQCILAFTKDRDPNVVRAFDRFMHFVE